MDSNQIMELATNVRLGHWPAHLGITDEQSKLDYLAGVLEGLAATASAVTDMQECDECWPCAEHGGDDDRSDTLQEEIDELKEEIEERKDCSGCTLCEEHGK